MKTVHGGIVGTGDEVVEFLVLFLSHAVLGGQPESTDGVDTLSINLDGETNKVGVFLNNVWVVELANLQEKRGFHKTYSRELSCRRIGQLPPSTQQ